MDFETHEDARPTKRARHGGNDGADDLDISMNEALPAPAVGGGQTVIANMERDKEQIEKERNCGITAYIRPDDSGFSGILKQR